ncbi:MAG: rRNA maturation RNase YbeY [Alphaproteobacteria bacterium]|nr:rRNA maturation RNase YbeY [Alphaproteobacteria bacterium]
MDVEVLDPRWLGSLRTARAICRRAAEAAIDGCGTRLPDRVSLAIALDNDAAVRRLNRTYRGYDKPTNVLSFPAAKGDGQSLGDIVLARQTVLREAREQGKRPADHLTHLVMHGTLHLLGYDHEQGERQARRMERLETRLLAAMGIADPYA